MDNNLQYIARQLIYWQDLENESMSEKITLNKNWQVTHSARVFIYSATYRQALTYINRLRIYGVQDIRIKPLEV
jgi:hypothetical protein